jgi:hypothetical protein
LSTYPVLLLAVNARNYQQQQQNPLGE